MSRLFDGFISYLSKETGYGYDFLIDRYNEVVDEDGDVEYFINVTIERDW